MVSASFLSAIAVPSVPFLLLLWRRPLLRRLALRNARSRPREAALVIAGALLGTAIMTGSLVVGDTLRASFEQSAVNGLGPIDEVVQLRDEAGWKAATDRLATAPVRGVTGALPIAVLGTPAASLGASHRRAAPHAQMLELGPTRSASVWRGRYGVAAPLPKPGHALVSDRLARKLHVGRGGRLAAYAYGQRVVLTVDRVLAQRGVAAFAWGLQSQPYNLVVAPGTVASLAASLDKSASGDIAPPAWLVAVSNTGDVRDGVARTGAAVRALEQRAAGIDVVQIEATKREQLHGAQVSGRQITQFYTAMGMFGVLAGMLLLVNVLTMLAEERTAELGMMRAVGLRRTSLVGAFALEGWLYSVVAAAIGAFAGVGLGRVLVVVMLRVVSSVQDVDFKLVFHVRPETLNAGVTGGLVVSMLNVLFTSFRISRLDVIRAIRDLPEVPRRRRRRVVGLGALAMVVGAGWTASGLTADVVMGLLLGPVVTVIGAGLVLDRYSSRRAVITLGAIAVLAWEIALPFTSHQPATSDLVPSVLQGVVLTAAAVLLICQQQDRLGRLLRRIGPGRGVSTRLGLAHPVGRPTRTALTLAPFSLVVFTIAFVTSLTGLLSGGIATQSKASAGGYDAVVTSNPTNPISFDALKTRRDVDEVAMVARLPVTYVVREGGQRHVWFLSAFDKTLLSARPPRLIDRGRYSSDAAAWRAVARNPDLIITTSTFLQNTDVTTEFVGPTAVGRRFTIIDPDTDQARVVRVAALVAGDLTFGGAWYGRGGARELFGGKVVTNRALVAVKGDAQRFADRVGSAYVANGAEADTFGGLARGIFDFLLSLISLFKAYLALGLVVGLAGIGVVMVRAVRERRHEIGVLRAMGFEAGHISRSFLVETGFVAAQAVAIGVSLAVVTTYAVAHSRTTELLLGGSAPLHVPQVQIAALVGLTVAAALLAAVGPARRAARIPPSEALRLVD